MISRYENLIKTATWWAVVGGQELPLCNGHGHPQVLSPDGVEILIPSGTAIYERNIMYMLKLTQEQLEFLIIVQGQDDWHPTAFVETAAKHYEASDRLPFQRTEFESMMAELRSLTPGKIANFQIALNYLENL
ncbi:hypothetical protein [Nostoc sp.]